MDEATFEERLSLYGSKTRWFCPSESYCHYGHNTHKVLVAYFITYCNKTVSSMNFEGSLKRFNKVDKA